MVSGKYVQTFAEATHALPEGMHMNADYPFKLPAIVRTDGKQVTLRGSGGVETTAAIKRKHGDGREYCDIEQSSTFEKIYRRQPTLFRCYPFKDEHTEIPK